MSGPYPANMKSCDPKCRCIAGPYEGVAYSCKNPCGDSGALFNRNTCECAQPGDSGCWLYERISEGKDVGEDSATRKLWQNVPGEGDFFGSNELDGDEFQLNMYRTQGSSVPATGFSHTPNTQVCTDEDILNATCDFSSATWELPQQNEDCVTAAREDSRSSQVQVAVMQTNGEAAGSIARTVEVIPGVSGDGTAHCTVSNLTATKDSRFPDWATCANPYRIWVKTVKTSAFHTISAEATTVCNPDLCGAGLFTWQPSSTAFIELESGPELSFWYNGPYENARCSDVQGGLNISWTMKSAWVVDTSLPTNNPFRFGSVDEGPFIAQSQSFGNPTFLGGPIAERADAYIGPAEYQGSFPPDGSAPEGFELLASWVNSSSNIYCSSGA